ncbi:DSD1 family PLP-dependent enzyme [Fuscibacter oryzae]|uniref:DSD1 family PLP-dependent enzyme n=1 Tax=Fuscibacter oryzae TaxID=2803939 RepID=A0A8J7MQ85_9RHOB|nr:DSD1 family PLP-dependent enzyme [Fuscibacter oryzae]MBL4926740.1 DSD1 family PLP-dependent enzyme [Fuscibacter oryzae]
MENLEPGYDIPALPGWREDQVQTPALLVDLDALEANIARMAAAAQAAGVALRPHGKMHKSADVARLQMAAGAVGLCCQKVSEAEAFVRAGLRDVLVTNQIVDPAKIDRLARLAGMAAVGVCVDNAANVADLSAACLRHGTTLRVLVEVDTGQARCGVDTPDQAVALARAIQSAPGLDFGGVQAYQGAMQHLPTHAERQAAFQASQARLVPVLAALQAAGIACPTVTGGGTGSWGFEAASGLWTELQCGSYAFMDADYGRITGAGGSRLDAEWQNALFVLAQVMSLSRGRAVCDAGLKAMTAESGLPLVRGREGVTYQGYSDEHGQLDDPAGRLRLGDRIRLVPGHCDPTCNLHDWMVATRGGVVQALWPVTARGKVF